VINQCFRGVPRTCKIQKEHRRWFVDGVYRPDLDHCDDVDLNLTPSTNTSAIRRANLAIGETARIVVAYVSFPELLVTTELQSYERTSDRQYLYRSLTTDFTAYVDVDEDGLVVLYHGIWRRIAYERGRA